MNGENYKKNRKNTSMRVISDMGDMSSIAIIPARYGSTRFPGKVLQEIAGKPMVQWVYERVIASDVDEVYIAADDEKVLTAVNQFNGKVVMTSPEHPSGTDRVWEAVSKINSDAEIIINVQGDEPMLPTQVINDLLQRMRSNSDIEMATVAVPVQRAEVQDNPNIVKTVLDEKNFALYFSRAPIPFLRVGGKDTVNYRHWGIYAYRKDILEKIVSLPESPLEKCEKLEQLRALENGIRIYVIISNYKTIGVDTPEDLELVKKNLNVKENFAI